MRWHLFLTGLLAQTGAAKLGLIGAVLARAAVVPRARDALAAPLQGGLCSGTEGEEGQHTQEEDKETERNGQPGGSATRDTADGMARGGARRLGVARVGCAGRQGAAGGAPTLLALLDAGLGADGADWVDTAAGHRQSEELGVGGRHRGQRVGNGHDGGRARRGPAAHGVLEFHVVLQLRGDKDTGGVAEGMT